MKIHFIAVGGTIDKIYFDAKSEYAVGAPQAVAILQEANVTFEIEVTPLMAKDSLDMTDADRQLIRRQVEASPSRHVVITHGTDTMVNTALALGGIAGKTIVLTGSMHPARFKTSDAEFNLGVAIGAVQSLPPGVYIAMNGRIFNPHHVRKNRQQQCFEET